jgi:hypothetical protein
VTISSYYYERDPATGRLRLRRDANGVALMDSIPVVVERSNPIVGGTDGFARRGNKQNSMQLGFAVAYFNRAHNFAIADGDEERLLQAMNASLLGPDVVAMIRARFLMKPKDRMRLERVDEAVATSPGFVQARACCDVFTDPMCRAMTAALSNCTFRRTVPLHQRDATSGVTSVKLATNMPVSDGVEDQFLVDFPPRSFVVVQQRGGERREIRVNINRLYSLLVIPRDNRVPAPVFANGQRASHTAKHQLRAALGVHRNRAGTDSRFIDYCSNLASYLDMDPDAIDAHSRHMRSGCRPNSLMEKYALQAGCDPNVPWHYGPNYQLIYNMLYKRRTQQLRTAYPGTSDDIRFFDRELSYPADDILDEVRVCIKLADEQRSGQYHSITPLGPLLIGRTTAATTAAAVPTTEATAPRSSIRDILRTTGENTGSEGRDAGAEEDDE